jgi:hypothetical protein
MKLWTIQSYERWQRLQRDGVLHQLRVEDENRISYGFMSQRLAAKAGPAPVEQCWPIWAWSQWRGPAHPHPDLTDDQYTEADGSEICLELEIPESRVLLSQYAIWTHGPYSHLPIFASQSYVDRFLKRLEKAGIPWHYEGLEAILSNAKFGKLVRRSWEKVFDLNYESDLTDDPETQRIQAVFWELRLQDVIKIQHVGGGI